MREVDMAVVGAGPAGLSAALAASRAGAGVLLIDRYSQPGGQYFKQLPPGFAGNGRPDWGTDEKKGDALLRGIRTGVDVLTNTETFALDAEKTLALAQSDQFFRVRARKVILATGAYERPVPFPGWTLPGVFAVGAMQNLAKIQRVLPGRRILVAGSGPLLYAVASTLLDAGAEVVALVEASRLAPPLHRFADLCRSWRPIARGLNYLAHLWLARVPILRGHTILRAEGEDRVRRVVVAPVDDDWQPLSRGERTFAVDAVGVGFGFLPSTELARLAGCAMFYKPDAAAFVPHHSPEMETSLPGIFVAGEVADIGGASIAMAQGRIAGMTAARQLGFKGDGSLSSHLAAARRELDGLEPFRRAMNELFGLRPGIWSLMTDDTIVCRCEEVTKAKVREAAVDSALDAREVKYRAWAGMGSCQARFCGDVLLRIIAEAKGVPIESVPQPRARPPVGVVPVAALLNERD